MANLRPPYRPWHADIRAIQDFVRLDYGMTPAEVGRWIGLRYERAHREYDADQELLALARATRPRRWVDTDPRGPVRTVVSEDRDVLGRVTLSCGHVRDFNPSFRHKVGEERRCLACRQK